MSETLRTDKPFREWLKTDLLNNPSAPPGQAYICPDNESRVAEGRTTQHRDPRTAVKYVRYVQG